MANSRLYIVCKKCNDFIGLMTYWPPGGFIAGDQGWTLNKDQERVDTWIKKHEEHAVEIDYNGGEYFAFVTEGDKRLKLIDLVNRKIILNK